MQAIARLFTFIEPNRVKAHGWSSLPSNDGKAIDEGACKGPFIGNLRDQKGEQCRPCPGIE